MKRTWKKFLPGMMACVMVLNSVAWSAPTPVMADDSEATEQMEEIALYGEDDQVNPTALEEEENGEEAGDLSSREAAEDSSEDPAEDASGGGSALMDDDGQNPALGEDAGDPSGTDPEEENPAPGEDAGDSDDLGLETEELDPSMLPELETEDLDASNAVPDGYIDGGYGIVAYQAKDNNYYDINGCVNGTWYDVTYNDQGFGPGIYFIDTDSGANDTRNAGKITITTTPEFVANGMSVMIRYKLTANTQADNFIFSVSTDTEVAENDYSENIVNGDVVTMSSGGVSLFAMSANEGAVFVPTYYDYTWDVRNYGTDPRTVPVKTDCDSGLLMYFPPISLMAGESVEYTFVAGLGSVDTIETVINQIKKALNSAIDFRKETLKELTPNATYRVNCEEVDYIITADENGEFPLSGVDQNGAEYNFINKTITLTELNESGSAASESANVDVSDRPVPPDMSQEGQESIDPSEAEISRVLIGPYVVMVREVRNQEYSIDGGETWISPTDGYVTFEDLEDTVDYTILTRIKATNTSFHSEPVVVKVTTAQERMELKAVIDTMTAEGYEGVYDGQEHSITVDPKDFRVDYRTNEAAAYDPQNPGFREVGIYTVYYRIGYDKIVPVTGSAVVKILRDLDPQVDHREEIITGLTPDTVYKITVGEEEYWVRAGEDGTIPMTGTDLEGNPYDLIGSDITVLEYNEDGEEISNPIPVQVGPRADAPGTDSEGEPSEDPENAEGSHIRTGTDSIQVDAVEGQEYSIDGGRTWITPTDGVVIFGGLEDGEDYTILTRIAPTDHSCASEPVEIGEVPWEARLALRELTAEGVDCYYDGDLHFIVVHGGEYTVEYCDNEEGVYSSENPGYRAVGEYTVRYAISGDDIVTIYDRAAVIIRPRVLECGLDLIHETISGFTPGSTVRVTVGDEEFIVPVGPDGTIPMTGTDEAGNPYTLINKTFTVVELDEDGNDASEPAVYTVPGRPATPIVGGNPAGGDDGNGGSGSGSDNDPGNPGTPDDGGSGGNGSGSGPDDPGTPGEGGNGGSGSDNDPEVPVEGGATPGYPGDEGSGGGNGGSGSDDPGTPGDGGNGGSGSDDPGTPGDGGNGGSGSDDPGTPGDGGNGGSGSDNPGTPGDGDNGGGGSDNDPSNPGGSGSEDEPGAPQEFNRDIVQVGPDTLRLPGTPGQEYSIDGGLTWIVPDEDGFVTFEDLDLDDDCTIITRIKATEDHLASESIVVAQILGDTRRVLADMGAEDVEVDFDGAYHCITVQAGDYNVEYCDTEDGEYGPENPSYRAVGEYVVYYRITGDDILPISGSAKIIIHPVPGSVRVHVYADGGLPEVRVDNLNPETGEQELTEEELAAIANGANCDVYFKVKQLPMESLDGAEQAELREKMGINQVGVLIDITLFKQLTDGEAVQIRESETVYRITVKLPDYMRQKNNSKGYRVIRLHDGEAEILDLEVSADGIMTFETDRFSAYCLSYHDHDWDDGKITREPTATRKGVKTYTCKLCGETRTEEFSDALVNASPQTGDDTNRTAWGILMILAALAMGIVLRPTKKRR